MAHQPTTVVLSVLEAVASAEGADPVDLPPLSSAIDPEALNDLFGGDRRGTPVRLSFAYCGHGITVFGDGRVAVGAVGAPPAGGTGAVDAESERAD